jgi:hypothetical protein
MLFLRGNPAGGAAARSDTIRIQIIFGADLRTKTARETAKLA